AEDGADAGGEVAGRCLRFAWTASLASTGREHRIVGSRESGFLVHAKRKQKRHGAIAADVPRTRHFTGPHRQRRETNPVSETFPRPPIRRWRQGRPISPHHILFLSPHQPFQLDAIFEIFAEFPKVSASSR